MIVETNWPAVCSGVTLSDASLPVSVEGQSTWTSNIRSVLEGLPGKHGIGFAYFEPGWVGNAALGSSCTVRSSHQDPLMKRLEYHYRIICSLMTQGLHGAVFLCSQLLCKL